MTLLTVLYPSAATGAIALGLPNDFVLGNGIARPEFIYVGTETSNNELTSVNEASLHKFRIAEATHATNGQGRLRQLVGVSNGIFHAQGTLGWEAFDDPVDPTLSATASYYWRAEFPGKLYMGDGINSIVYDAKKGTLEKFEAVGAGEVPQAVDLACVYRKRLVLAGGTKWYMSKAGDPHNFDYFPAVRTTTDAVADSTIDKPAPDIIKALIPGHDDYLIFGCASSIRLMRGDPLTGGEMDLVSDEHGMAFGNAWARDPGGIIYYFGSRGGVYRMAPGGLPESISDATGNQDVTVQAEFEAISLNDYRMELEWDFEHDELLVFQIPYDTESTTIVRSWAWSKKANAWWPDRVGASKLIPFAVAAGDGDLVSDRTPLIGCRDGYLRSLSDLALNDDETPIDAHVTLGPIQTGNDSEVTINRIKAILAREKGGCTFEIFSADTPDALDAYPYDKLVFQGTFVPGHNPRLPARCRGPYLWIRLRNKKVGESFAVEEISADLGARGARRATV